MKSRIKAEVQKRSTLKASALTALLVVAFLPIGSNAQPQDGDTPRLTGTWDRRGLIESSNPMRLTARAIGFSQAFDEALSPRYDCSPVPLPFIIRDPYNFSVEQQSDRVILRYEKDDVTRTVWLEGYDHAEPGPYDFTIQGHSTGQYESNQLIVKTRQFTFDPTGLANTGIIPSSTLKNVIERYWREGDRLIVNVTTEDPLILLEPYEFTFEWQETEIGLITYGCDPELARFPAQFQPSKYQDPGWVRLPATEIGVNR